MYRFDEVGFMPTFCFSPEFYPGDAMIASDFLRMGVPAIESVSGHTVEEARAPVRKKDK